VRDAGTQGRQERGPGPHRDLAGRTRELIEDILRLALAIAADAAAFRLWNLAGRSPARLLRDIAGGLPVPATFLRGAARGALGLALITAAAELVLPVAIEGHTFTVLETWTLLTGLFVDGLIGPLLRL
jgi:hypothetical protein